MSDAPMRQNTAALVDAFQAQLAEWRRKIDGMISLRRHVLELATVCEQLRTQPTSFSGRAFELYIQRLRRAQDLMAEITARMEALK